MTPEQQYTAMKEAALKIGVEIKEKNLHVPGIRVKSGLCSVRGRQIIILDKKKTLREKIAIAAGCISGLDYRNSGLSDEIIIIIDRFAGVSDD